MTTRAECKYKLNIGMYVCVHVCVHTKSSQVESKVVLVGEHTQLFLSNTLSIRLDHMERLDLTCVCSVPLTLSMMYQISLSFGYAFFVRTTYTGL